MKRSLHDLLKDDDSEEEEEKKEKNQGPRIPIIAPSARWIKEADDAKKTPLLVPVPSPGPSPSHKVVYRYTGSGGFTTPAKRKEHEQARDADKMNRLKTAFDKEEGVYAFDPTGFYTRFKEAIKNASEQLHGLYEPIPGLPFDVEKEEALDATARDVTITKTRVRAFKDSVVRARTQNPTLAGLLANSSQTLQTLVANQRWYAASGGDPTLTVAEVAESIVTAADRLRPRDLTDLVTAWLDKLDAVATAMTHASSQSCSLVLLPYVPTVGGGDGDDESLEAGLLRSQEDRVPWWNLFLVALKKRKNLLFSVAPRLLFVFWPLGRPVPLLEHALTEFHDIHVAYIGPADVDATFSDQRAHVQVIRAAAAALCKASGQRHKMKLSLLMPLATTTKMAALKDDPVVTEGSTVGLLLNATSTPLVCTWGDVLAEAMGDRTGRSLNLIPVAKSTPFAALGNIVLPFAPFAYDFPNDFDSSACAATALGFYQEEEEADKFAARVRSCVMCAKPALFACACGDEEAVYCSDDGECQRKHCYHEGHCNVCSCL